MASDTAFFPALRCGELLYSVLARHSRWSAVGGPKAIMGSLFGNAAAAATIDLPNRLAALEKHLPSSTSIDDLIDQHTLAPYYCAFVPADMRRAIRVGMKGDGGNLHLRSGLAAFRAGRVSRLRFCPECMIEMCHDWGSPHWRRDHQVPSTLVCPTHGSVLRMSNVDLHSVNRHDFVAATFTNCPRTAEPITRAVSSADGEILLRLARAGAALLQDAHCGPLDFHELTVFYREQLRDRGLMRSRLRVDQVALEEIFWDRFGTVAKRFPGLILKDGLQGDWLATLTRKQRKSAHPIEHLLLRDLLNSRSEHEEPYGKGPWPCRNPLSDHDGANVVTNLHVYRNRQVRVAVFTCECGYRYTRSISITGKLGPCRFKDFGPLLRPALVEMIAIGMSLRGVARRLRIDPKTVATLAAQQEIETPWDIRPSSRRPRRIALEIAVVQKPTPARRAAAKPRRDWRRLDMELAARVTSAAAYLKSASPPRRVTSAALERELLGRLGWIAKRNGKLPRTVDAMTGVVETVAAFQMRRVDFWIVEDVADGTAVRAWSIMRKAGLRSDMLSVIEKRLVALDTYGLVERSG